MSVPIDVYLQTGMEGGLCLRLMLVLVHVLWEGCVLALIFAAVQWSLHHASANLRYWTGVVTLLLMAACLPLNLKLIPAKISGAFPAGIAGARKDVSPGGRPAEAVVGDSALGQSVTAEELEDTSQPATARRGDRSGWQTLWVDIRAEWAGIAPYVVAGYLLGFLLMATRMVLSFSGGRRLCRDAIPCGSPDLLGVVRDSARRMALRTVPALGYCHRIFTPVVVGVLRPMILLPTVLATGLTPQQFQAVLLHELVHVRRYDLAVNVLQRLIETLLFFHPAVWWVSRRVSAERENACDDLVLRLDCGRTEYADALVRVAELCVASGSPGLANLAALSMAGKNPSQFKRRVLRLLGHDDRPRLRLTSLGTLMLSLLAVFLMLTPVAWCNLVGIRKDARERITAGAPPLPASPAESPRSGMLPPDKPDDKPPPKPGTISGNWRIRSLTLIGEDGRRRDYPRTKPRPVLSATISEKGITLWSCIYRFAEISYQLDTRRTPWMIDAEYQGRELLGICRRDGDKMKISLRDAARGRATDWDREGNNIVLELQHYSGVQLYTAYADGTGLHQLTDLLEYARCGSPQWSPDGTRIAFDAWRVFFGDSWLESHLFVVDAEGRQEARHLGPGTLPGWLPDGQNLLYSKYEPRGLYQIRADGSRGERISSEGWSVRGSPVSGEIAYTLSLLGTANLCVRDPATGESRLLLEERYVSLGPGIFWSPDGRWICFKGKLPDESEELAVVHREGQQRGFRILLPREDFPGLKGFGNCCAWRPDGREILLGIITQDNPNYQLHRLDAEGRTAPRRLNWQDPDRNYFNPAWSPDGKKIVFNSAVGKPSEKEERTKSGTP
ncbi:MAG: PD40 domain-containing protein [Pirellulales bacterium]|nr:PD40 domain-containing protein [Pirellulales bacterium]